MRDVDLYFIVDTLMTTWSKQLIFFSLLYIPLFESTDYSKADMPS